MGIIAKFIYRTPFGKYYKKYNYRKWEAANAKLEKELFPKRINFYSQFLSKGDLVFDVGANVGNRVKVFLELDSKVVAVEPQPQCVHILTQTFGKSIIIEPVGLSDKDGELTMHIASDSTVSTFDGDYIKQTEKKFKFTKWENTINVPVTTLDKLVLKYGVPKFCKIDVEGFELQVLKGLNSPIPFISLEYIAPERVNALKDCLIVLHALCKQALFNYSIQESMILALSEWMNYDQFLEHINTPPFLNSSFGDVYFKAKH